MCPVSDENCACWIPYQTQLTVRWWHQSLSVVRQCLTVGSGSCRWWMVATTVLPWVFHESYTAPACLLPPSSMNLKTKDTWYFSSIKGNNVAMCPRVQHARYCACLNRIIVNRLYLGSLDHLGYTCTVSGCLWSRYVFVLCIVLVPTALKQSMLLIKWVYKTNGGLQF